MQSMQTQPSHTDGLEAAVQEFLDKGKVTIYFPISELIPPLVDAVMDLVSDARRRDAWSLKIDRPDEPNDHPDDGLVRKTKLPDGAPNDNKWYFHYRTSLRKDLLKHGVHIGPHGELIRSAAAVHAACLDMKLNFARAFDRVAPGYALAERMMRPEAMKLHVLRVLLYDYGTDIGKPHTDRSGITGHIADSRPGLRTGPERTPYVAQINRALLFGGQKLQRLTGNEALEHDVVDTTPEPDKIGERWSVIFFTHFASADLP